MGSEIVKGYKKLLLAKNKEAAGKSSDNNFEI